MNSADLSGLWVYLAATPLLGLTLTLLAYLIAWHIHQRLAAHPLANPVMLAVALLVTLLWLTDTPYQTYFDGAQFVHFLLGPATVALAIPLYAQLQRLRQMAMPLGVTLLLGAVTACACLGAAIGACAQEVRPSFDGDDAGSDGGGFSSNGSSGTPPRSGTRVSTMT